MHEARLTPVLVGAELYEANQFFVKERADKNASIQEGGFHSAYGFEILSIMPKPLPLPDRGFVVDSSYSLNEGIIERHFTNDHSALVGFSNLIPDLEINLMLHPVVKGGNAK